MLLRNAFFLNVRNGRTRTTRFGRKDPLLKEWRSTTRFDYFPLNIYMYIYPFYKNKQEADLELKYASQLSIKSYLRTHFL